jgi:CubicO group peptidase (beta-lactamase class C family)
MRKAILLAACGVLAIPAIAANIPTAKAEQAGMSTDRLQRLSAAMRGYIDRGEVAGTVTLVARHGKIVHLEAQGLMDIESKTPMRTDAIFRIASMTKPLTSISVMMLLEEGRLQITDPVSRYIPEFKNPMVKVANAPGSNRAGSSLVPANREITIRDLLTHTAGLAADTSVVLRDEFQQFQKERGPNDTIADFTRRLAKLPLAFHPGTAWEYGPATDVLGYLVEVVSGKSFEAFLNERILRPLEMNDTFFYVPDNKLNRLVTAYQPAQPKGIRAMGRAPDMRGSKTFFSGAGGLFSTAEDYSRFAQMLLGGGTYNGARLVSRKTIELMTANHIGDLPLWPDLAGYRFGLGFRVLADPGQSGYLGSPGTYGWAGARGTYFWVDPKEDMFGVLMTQIQPFIGRMRLESHGLALQAITD